MMKVSLGKSNSEQTSFEVHKNFAQIVQRIEMSLAFPPFGSDEDIWSDWREEKFLLVFLFQLFYVSLHACNVWKCDDSLNESTTNEIEKTPGQN